MRQTISNASIWAKSATSICWAATVRTRRNWETRSSARSSFFSQIDNEEFSYFLERPLEAVIGDFELSGKVDGMVATGFRNPKKPFFCMNEYKRATDPDGAPQGQALIAMLVAQNNNDNKNPIFGCFIVGKQWHFMVLEGKQYAISHSFACDDDEIFDIHRVLRGLRFQIERLLKPV